MVHPICGDIRIPTHSPLSRGEIFAIQKDVSDWTDILTSEVLDNERQFKITAMKFLFPERAMSFGQLTVRSILWNELISNSRESIPLFISAANPRFFLRTRPVVRAYADFINELVREALSSDWANTVDTSDRQNSEEFIYTVLFREPWGHTPL